MSYRTTEAQRNLAIHNKADKLSKELGLNLATVYLIAREMGNPMADYLGDTSYAQIVSKEEIEPDRQAFTLQRANRQITYALNLPITSAPAAPADLLMTCQHTSVIY